MAYRVSLLSALAYKRLTENGGFSVRNPNGENPPDYGFMVSAPDTENRVSGTASRSDIARYILARLADIPNGAYFGGWQHNGETYLDVSVWERSELQALVSAFRNGQLCVWDIARSRSIFVADRLENASDCKIQDRRNRCDVRTVVGRFNLRQLAQHVQEAERSGLVSDCHYYRGVSYHGAR